MMGLGYTFTEEVSFEGGNIETGVLIPMIYLISPGCQKLIL